MDLPARQRDEDLRNLARTPDDDGPHCYLHHSDGSWSSVGDDGWPVSPLDFCAKPHADAMAAIAAVTFAPIDADLLADVRRGLLSTIDVDPESVVDTEI